MSGEMGEKMNREKIWRWVNENLGPIDTFDIVAEDGCHVEIDVHDVDGKTKNYLIARDEL